MGTLICTVGLPRSGKSSWAREQGAPIVNPDSIRLAIHGQAFISEAEPFVWATAKYMVKALFLAGHETVIVDATNTTRKRRDDWIGDWSLRFKVFPATVAECLERVGTYEPDIQDVMKRVIARMGEQFEPLEDDEIEVTDA